MIMENYHQSYDELDHNAKSELRQSNHYTAGVDTICLMKTINTIYSVVVITCGRTKSVIWQYNTLQIYSTKIKEFAFYK